MNLVFFDLETGGLELHHPIIQIAAVATMDFQEIDSFESKIMFDISTADTEALALNSYDLQLWNDDALPEFAVVGDFASWLRNYSDVEMISKRTGRPYRVARLAGHNADRFDGPRLQAMFKRHGAFLPASPQVLDTAQLALWQTRTRLKSYKLSDLCAHFGIDTAGAHDALADVRMCAKLAEYLMKENDRANR